MLTTSYLDHGYVFGGGQLARRGRTAMARPLAVAFVFYLNTANL